MIGEHRVIAIIPARAGSRRCPGKNVRPLCGKPMVLWTIEAAKAAKYLDLVVVTTDDGEANKLAQKAGVPVVGRPPEMASDYASVYDAIFHALDFFPPHDYVCLLQPTSPLRVGDDIDACILRCFRQWAPACVSVDQTRPVPNGAVYVAWISWLKEMRQFDSGRAVACAIPVENSVDVDTEADFARAERLMSLRLSGE